MTLSLSRMAGIRWGYSGSLFRSRASRKANCQIAVGLFHVGGSGLAVRWACAGICRATGCKDLDRLVATGVPEEYRLPQTRGSIALDLLDAALRRRLVGGNCFGQLRSGKRLRPAYGLDQRGLVCWTRRQMPGHSARDGDSGGAHIDEACRVLVAGLAFGIISKAGHGAASITMPAW